MFVKNYNAIIFDEVSPSFMKCFFGEMFSKCLYLQWEWMGSVLTAITVICNTTISTVTDNNKHVHRDLGSIRELHSEWAGSPVWLLPFLSVNVITKCIVKAEVLNMKIGFRQCDTVIYCFCLLLFFFISRYGLLLFSTWQWNISYTAKFFFSFFFFKSYPARKQQLSIASTGPKKYLVNIVV